MATRSSWIVQAGLAAVALLPLNAVAQDFFTGEIRWVGFNFAPQGWAMCNGQLLPVEPNLALFSLLGTTYGGDGVNTFGLPDMRSRFPDHQGQGPGLGDRSMGEQAGQETAALNLYQLPAHNHPALGSKGAGASVEPAGMLPAMSNAKGDPDGDVSTVKTYRAPGAYDTLLAPEAIGVVGGIRQAHDNLPPHLTLNCIIALDGIYPSRD
jgi:microcystin-dependent protein